MVHAQSKRCGRMISSPALVGFAALAAFTRHVGEAQEAYETYPLIGCYKDTRDRVMPRQLPVVPLTLKGCVDACILDSNEENEWKFVGLQFGQECFCGNRYTDYGALNSASCDMTAADSEEAGGRWAISVYDLQGSTTANAVLQDEDSQVNADSQADSQGDSDSGGDGTDSAKTLSAVESGSRAFTVVNKCSQTIRIGSTGGRISFDSGDETDPDLCEAWGRSAVYNPGPMGIGCYWTLPDEAGGNTDRELGPGESFRYNLHETASETRWSGTIWASTGCKEVDGCATGVCYSPTTSHVCPAYVGPGGPTTKAEFTLSDVRNDYYDVSAIDGVNLPMMIEPDSPIFPDVNSNIDKYRCGSPGATSSPTDLADCTWSYEDHVFGIEDDLSQYLRLVLPDDYENQVTCTTDSDCNGQTCGVHPQRWANGAYKGGVTQGSCGEHVAWVSAGGACAGGWTSGEFPDAFPFFCGESVANGQRANLYGCHGGLLAHSGYTAGADSTACGCPDWESENIKAPSISMCQGINTEWVTKAQPWAKHLKAACPTAYTFPYDDQTSTFMCSDMPNGADPELNTQSYTITFCPGESESAMFA